MAGLPRPTDADQFDAPAATRASRARLSRIASAVERWFVSARRELPWRTTRSGYRALVSEFMLQQTQVARVTPKFEAFMQRFPDVRALASAAEREVLAYWQGLGYYGRARRLHAAARMIVEIHDGTVPQSVEALLSLPGVGRYTAGSIASIVFGARVPIVDTNIARVLARIHGRVAIEGRAADAAWAWEEARRLVDACVEPALLNEGLMELGALVCQPSAPTCDECPLARLCAARSEARAAGGSFVPLRVRRPSSARRRIVHHVVLIVGRGRIRLEQRPERGLWASMWQAPTVEAHERLACAEVAARLGIDSADLLLVTEVEHRTSHRDVLFLVHRAAGRVRVPAERSGAWVRPEDIDSYPLSNPMRRIVDGAWDRTQPDGGAAVTPGRRRPAKALSRR